MRCRRHRRLRHTRSKRHLLAVHTVHVRVLEKHEEKQLRRVRRQRYKQHRVAAGEQRQAIVPRIANAVHWIRRHLVYTVKHKTLQAQKEAVAPVPRIVLDDSMGIHLDPYIEYDQQQAHDPAHDKDQHAVRTDTMHVRETKERVCSKVVQQDHIDQRSKQNPHIVLQRHVFKFVRRPQLGLQLLTQPRRDARAPARIEPSTLLRKPNNPLRLALVHEDVSQPCVVRQTPYRKVHHEEDLCLLTRQQGEEHKLQEQ